MPSVDAAATPRRRAGAAGGGADRPVCGSGSPPLDPAIRAGAAGLCAARHGRGAPRQHGGGGRGLAHGAGIRFDPTLAARGGRGDHARAEGGVSDEAAGLFRRALAGRRPTRRGGRWRRSGWRAPNRRGVATTGEFPFVTSSIERVATRRSRRTTPLAAIEWFEKALAGEPRPRRGQGAGSASRCAASARLDAGTAYLRQAGQQFLERGRPGAATSAWRSNWSRNCSIGGISRGAL